jgi:hypothetical protein
MDRLGISCETYMTRVYNRRSRGPPHLLLPYPGSQVHGHFPDFPAL